MNPKKIQTINDFHKILEVSKTTPVLLIKLSPICPTSLQAQMEFESFLQTNPTSIDIYTIDVIAARPASRALAEEIKVRHESPQAIFFKDGEVFWHGSHYRLNREKFLEKTNAITKA